MRLDLWIAESACPSCKSAAALPLRLLAAAAALAFSASRCSAPNCSRDRVQVEPQAVMEDVCMFGLASAPAASGEFDTGFVFKIMGRARAGTDEDYQM